LTVADKPSAGAALVARQALRIVRRDWRPLLISLPLLWLIWFLPRVLTGVLIYGANRNTAPASSVILGLGVLVLALQLVVVVWLLAGLLRLHIEGCRSGEPAPLGYVFSCGRCLGWLLLEVLVVAAALLVLVVLYRSALPNAVLALLPVLAILLVTGLASQVLVVPLIVDRRLTTFAAMAASARTIVGRARPAHLALIAVAAAGTIAVSVATLWPGGMSDPLDVTAVYGIIVGTHLGLAAVFAAIGVAGCLVSVPLVASLYVGLSRAEPAVPSAAVPARTWKPLLVLALAGVLVLGLAYGASWAFSGIDSARNLPSGQRVTLHNGLSLVPPAGTSPRLTEYREYPAWLPIGQNAHIPDSYFEQAGIFGAKDSLFFGEQDVGDAGFLSITSLYSADAYMLLKAQRSPVLASTADGSVTIRGHRGSRYLWVVTRLPGAMPGLAWVWFKRGDSPESWSAKRQNAALARLWRNLAVEGAPLPIIR
jgi:hypothetical protein